MSRSTSAALPGAAVRDDDRRARRSSPQGSAKRRLGAPASARRAVRARGAIAVDVVTPRSLDEALRLKAELPEARSRPGRHGPAGGAELRPLAPAGADQPERGGRAARLAPRERLASCSAPGSPTRRRCAVSVACLAAGAGGGLANGRLAADPQPRHDRRQPRHRARPPATRCRRCSSKAAAVEIASVRGARALPLQRVSRRCEAERARGATSSSRRCGCGRAGAPQTFMKVGPRNAMVIAVCSLAVVVDAERGEVRAAFGSAAPTATTGDRRRSRRPRRCRMQWLPRRARSTTCVALPPTGGMRSLCSPGARSRGAPREARADASTASVTRRTSGVARASSTCCASGSASRARRTRASRGSAARARCCSTAPSCARASCWPRRRRVTT